MNKPLFPDGIKGMADSKFSAYQGECEKIVGVDFRNFPGVITSHQKLTKVSGTTVSELCKNVIELSDGKKIWFSSESGKIWQQSSDTFTLLHTIVPATDYKEPNSVVNGVWDDENKETGITMSIAENDAIYGNISNSILSSIDTSKGIENSVCELSSGIYALAYAGTDNDGFLKTFQMTTSEVYEEIDNLEHDVANGRQNSICRIDDTHFMLAYNGGASEHGFIKTFSGPSTIAEIASLEHDATVTGDSYSSLIQIDATHYALAYAGGASNYGYIKIFTIDGAYAITQTSYLLHHNTSAVLENKLVLIDSTHFMLAYSNGSAGIIKTFSIDGAYAITEIDSLTNYASGNFEQSLIKLDATHYIWSGMVITRGYIKIFTIDGSYQITETSALDIKCTNYYPALLLNDETHVVLVSSTSTTGFTKTFEINSSYIFRELDSYDYSSLDTQDISILRSSTRILAIYSGDTDNKNYISSITMNETYANGIILKPSGTENITLIASKVISQTSMASQYLNTTIKIPEGYSNLDIVVITGRGGSTANPPVGATVEGSAMTQIVNRTNTYGFKCSSAFYNYKNPATGDNDIVIDFSTNITSVYAIVLVFANVHQTTSYSATYDYGWQDYLELLGATNGELRIGACLSKINTHYFGDIQDTVLQNNIAEDTERYTISVSTRKFSIGTAKILGASLFSYQQSEVIGDEDTSYEPEEQKEKIYYANEDVLFAVPVDKISVWATNIETVGVFRNGDDTYHPMVKQNLELYIGDKTVISKVTNDGDFIQETALNVRTPERIQVLSPYDTDILIGTQIINRARVLRWDTFSDSWISDDDVIETGINAFILDDDYTYVSAGDYGHLYFYNGEKLQLQKRISGNWNNDLIDSYLETNYDYDISTSRSEYWSQSFTVKNPGILDSIEFYLSITGALTGNITAKIYDMAGTIGTNGVPTGAVLATSDNLDISTLTSTPTLTSFTFSGVNKISLIEKNYCIVLYNSSNFTPTTNILKIGCKELGTYIGDVSYSSNAVTWNIGNPKLTYSMIFYINSDLIKTLTINPNAVGYLNGTPVFGISNLIGNPTLQGIYGYGGYDSKYPKSLSLDYPLPTGEFTGIEIGCININGADMQVSYKTATDVGIAKIDQSNKYTPAYLETVMLTSLQERSHETTEDGLCVDYITLPTGTSVSIGIKTKYDSAYTPADLVIDTDRMSIKTKSKIPKIVNLQAKISLVSSVNNAPEIENIGIL
jgi:hypothetical protein